MLLVVVIATCAQLVHLWGELRLQAKAIAERNLITVYPPIAQPYQYQALSMTLVVHGQ